MKLTEEQLEKYTYYVCDGSYSLSIKDGTLRHVSIAFPPLRKPVRIIAQDLTLPGQVQHHTEHRNDCIIEDIDGMISFTQRKYLRPIKYGVIITKQDITTNLEDALELANNDYRKINVLME